MRVRTRLVSDNIACAVICLVLKSSIREEVWRYGLNARVWCSCMWHLNPRAAVDPRTLCLPRNVLGIGMCTSYWKLKELDWVLWKDSSSLHIKVFIFNGFSFYRLVRKSVTVCAISCVAVLSPLYMHVLPCNENQLGALFIHSLFRKSTYTCFGHICSPSSGGILYIYNWYVLCFLVDWLLSELGWNSIPTRTTVDTLVQEFWIGRRSVV